ncbi:MAG: AAA family ATPase [Bacteroidales bacterium]|nr:AAA family ATPase [Bacteroidales bacterium]
MSKAKIRYPIGIQTFSNLREEGFLYIDKTEYVYELTHSDAKYVFLSRPRRFGKSLLVSTLRSYFEGRKDLFDGLAIEKLEKEWHKYPVLHFNMADGKHMDEERLEVFLGYQLLEWERVYGKDDDATTIETRMKAIIRRAYEKTGEKVVVLIDEYDAPLLDVVHEDENLPKLRKIMRNFYAPLKGADAYVRFVFMTGITKFSQLSIFSELNNINNISMLSKYSSICGITEDEMLSQMSIGIDTIADELCISREETIKKLKAKYDGYHFSKKSPDIYNPFSLLNCFSNLELGSYWFDSGTPTYLIEMLRKFDVSPIEIGGKFEASASDFDAPTERMTSVMALLYQSGYVTIKDYDEDFDVYSLAVPNEEVRTGLMLSLIPNYLQRREGSELTIAKMTRCFAANDINGAFTLLQTFFKTVPYCNDIDHEGHWQQMLYVIFSLFGAKGDVEIHTSNGRVDMAVVLWGKLYLIEIKLDRSAREALEQIEIKEYDRRFALCGLPVVKVGVNFSTAERTITEWIVG